MFQRAVAIGTHFTPVDGKTTLRHPRADGPDRHLWRPSGGSAPGRHCSGDDPRWARLSLLALLAVGAIIPLGVLSGGAALATQRSVPGASTPAPACSLPGSAEDLSQSLDGRVSGCWLVGAQAPGVDDVGLAVVTPPPPVGAAALGPHVTVEISPASGPPGTHVALSGTVSVPLPASGVTQFANVCFDGCGGLTESGVALHWLTKPGGRVAQRFRASVFVPESPWLVDGRAHGLVSGTYEIGVQCAGEEVGGCGLGAAQGSAPFHLEVAHPKPCPTIAACSSLRLVPDSAPPGSAVGVSGTAPLSQIIGQPFGYGLVDVGPSTATTGDETVVAREQFRVLIDTAWSDISWTKPLVLSPTGPPPGPVTADASAPGDVAWCDPTGSIELVSAKTGAEISTVPTTTVRAARLAPGLKLFASPPPAVPSCSSVLASPSNPTTYYAVFEAALPEGAPPVYQVGLVTTDSGRSWQEVPTPSGSAQGLISGFELGARGSVEALFAPSGPGAVPGATATGTTPGGRASGGKGSVRAAELAESSAAPGAPFRPASLTCPASGPCLLLGPYAPGNCAMNENFQQLLVMRDGRFVAGGDSPLPAAPDSCAPSSLAATGPSTALVVNSQSQFPLVETTDGGRSFVPVALPPLRLVGSGGPTVLGQGASFEASGAGLVLLQSGALLATTGGGPDVTLAGGSGSGPASGHWELLVPHATRWCTTAKVAVTSSTLARPPAGDTGAEHPSPAPPFLEGFVPVLGGCGGPRRATAIRERRAPRSSRARRSPRSPAPPADPAVPAGGRGPRGRWVPAGPQAPAVPQVSAVPSQEGRQVETALYFPYICCRPA
jgi:hypothetical protein